MMLPIIAIFQSVVAADAGENSDIRASADGCERRDATADEIVVCGRREGQSPYRIGPQSEQRPALPDAEFKLLNGVGVKVHAQQGEVGGIPTNRGLISLKIRF